MPYTFNPFTANLDYYQVGSGGTPGGDIGSIQFNDSGAFGGITGSSWDGTNLTLPDTPILGAGSGTALGIPAIAASGHITPGTGFILDGDTVTVGSITYTFKDTLTGGDYEVLNTFHATQSTLTDLGVAINAAGQNGIIDQASAPNPDIIASTPGDPTPDLTLYARVGGTVGNGLTVSSSTAALTVTPTLSGGDDGALFPFAAMTSAVFGASAIGTTVLNPNGAIPSTVAIYQSPSDNYALSLVSPDRTTLSFNVGASLVEIFAQQGGNPTDYTATQLTIENLTNQNLQLNSDGSVYLQSETDQLTLGSVNNGQGFFFTTVGGGFFFSGGNATFGSGSVTASDFIVSGSAFKTDTVDAHVGLFQAYDVDGATYRTFATLTNGNTPSFALSAPSGGTLSGDFSTLKVGGTDVLTSVTGHNLLSATHPDTTAGSVARGDLITGQGASAKWVRLVKGTANQVLAMDGTATDILWVTPSSGAPTDATYITQTASTGLSAEQALSSLSSGIMRVATTTGVITSLGDILPTANGGTGIAFFTAAGPSVARIYTFPDAAATIAYAGMSGLALTSPVLTTPSLGVATATSINGNVFTTGSSTYTGTAGQTYTFPTTSATIARTDAANTFTGIQTESNAGIGAASTDGLIVQNATASALGAQQWSPRIRLHGQGWSTSNGDRPLDWIIENQTVQGGSNPATKLVISSSVNNGAYVAQLTIDQAGFQITSGNDLVLSGGAPFVATASTAYFGWRNASTKLFSDANNQLDLRNGTNAERFNIGATFTSASVREDLSLYVSSSVGHIGMTTTGATARVLQLDYGGTTTAAISIPITSGAVTFGGGITLSAADIATDTTTGTKLGTATTQKIGFFNATPIVQVPATTDLGLALSNLGLRAAGTTVLDSPKITTGVNGDGSGFKHKRVTTGSIAAGSTALIDVTWGTAFADTNYTAEVSVVDSTNTSLSLSIVHIETVATDKIQVRVLNNALGALTGTVHAVAVHD